MLTRSRPLSRRSDAEDQILVEMESENLTAEVKREEVSSGRSRKKAGPKKTSTKAIRLRPRPNG